MLLAPMRVPLPSRSPCLTRTYTCGTIARVVVPSARVTSRSTSQTMSLVSWAICSALRATPGRRFQALA
ncbi:hypothetical protein D3C84_887890 [compost metagenome]